MTAESTALACVWCVCTFPLSAPPLSTLWNDSSLNKRLKCELLLGDSIPQSSRNRRCSSYKCCPEPTGRRVELLTKLEDLGKELMSTACAHRAQPSNDCDDQCFPYSTPRCFYTSMPRKKISLWAYTYAGLFFFFFFFFLSYGAY